MMDDMPAHNITPFRNFVPELEENLRADGRLEIDSDLLFPLLQTARSLLSNNSSLLCQSEDFSTWAKTLGVDCWQFPDDAVTLWQRGWLRADESVLRRTAKNHSADQWVSIECDEPLGSRRKAAGRWATYEIRLHRFRLYPFIQLLHTMDWQLTRSAMLHPGMVERHANEHVRKFREWQKHPRLLERHRWWNGIADLAIMLEPLYWPRMTDSRADSEAQQHSDKVPEEYRELVMNIFRRVYKARVAQAHMELRYAAARLDRNGPLYLLARTAHWYKRESMRGNFGCALWLRHTAELLRHGFEDIYGEKLAHEDQSSEVWIEGARSFIYGSDYPLDHPEEMARQIILSFGFPSSRGRVYVEGPTEAGAIAEILGDLAGHWIEIVDMKAQFGSKGGGYLTGLKENLIRDIAAKRFSFAAFDGDNYDLVRALKLRVQENLIVGSVLLSKPDFESLFSVSQKLEAIHDMECSMGQEFEPLLVSDFEGARTGSEFENQYKKLRSAQKLKGESWGRALARVAFKRPVQEGSDSFKFVRFAEHCVRCIRSNYDIQRFQYRIDEDFNLIKIQDKSWPT